MSQTEKSGWSIRTLAERLGISASTLSDWIKEGLVTPQGRSRGRSGFSIGIDGLFEAVTVLELKAAGFSLRQISLAVANVKLFSETSRPLVDMTLIVGGNDLVWKSKDSVDHTMLSLLQKPGQRLMVFPMGEIHSAILKELEREYEAELQGVL